MDDRGFGTIEIIVAMIVLAVGVMAFGDEASEIMAKILAVL